MDSSCARIWRVRAQGKSNAKQSLDPLLRESAGGAKLANDRFVDSTADAIVSASCVP
jgi:hypothetical protein